MPDISQSEVDALGGFKLIAGQYGGTPQSILKKIEDLEKDNRDLRARAKTAEEQLPKDGQVVLTKEQAAALTAYETLGKPEDLKKQLENGQQAVTKLADLEQRNAAVAFAKAAGIHEEAVDTLVALPALAGAKFEVRKGKVKDGRGNEVDGELGYITLSGENQKAQPFAEVLESVPGLKGLKMQGPTSPQNKGITFVPQGGGNGGANSSDNVFQRIRDRAKPVEPKPEEKAAKSAEERLGMIR